MANLLENKKAYFDFEILEKMEAGIELHGFEVKALRDKKGSLEGARVLVRGGEAFLVGAQIPAFQPKNAPKDYIPERNRRLLLTRKEIAELAGKEGQKGLTIVPIVVYNKGRLIKVSIGIGRGKKKTDKREGVKKRETDIEIRRTLKYE